MIGKEKAITNKAITNKDEIIDIVRKSKVCRIALSYEGIPYIVPVNYGYNNNTLYIHSARSGKKIDLLKKNNRVCFEVESDIKIVASDTACQWTTQYRCAIGYGKAQLLYDRESIIKALEIIMKHQSGRSDWTYSEEAINRVLIIKIIIDSITGKKS